MWMSQESMTMCLGVVGSSHSFLSIRAYMGCRTDQHSSQKLLRNSGFLGACAMTTKFLDNKICTFKILLSWRFPRKTAFWTIFSLPPRAPPPSKSENFIFIVVSPSLSFGLCRDPNTGLRWQVLSQTLCCESRRGILCHFPVAPRRLN